MSAKLVDVLGVLRSIAPEHLAESWDKVGLHVGDTSQRVKRVLLCIDLTEPVLAEAITQKADLVVAYHPPIFDPLERLTDATWKQRVLVGVVKREIAVYSPHTALDAVRGGLTDWLCEGIGKGKAEAIVGHTPGTDQHKVVVFVPERQVASVRDAMAQAGAGEIGDYRSCSFHAAGEGAFRPVDGANPYDGEVGRHETVSEVRLEMVCRLSLLPDVIAMARQAHPYEEPAIDVHPLAPVPDHPHQAAGAGRSLKLDRPVSPEALGRRVKKHLGLNRVRVAAPAVETAAKMVRTVSVCPGAGGSLFEESPEDDAFVTGEMRHHQVLDLVSAGKVVILTGHTNCERPYLPVYRERLVAACGQAGLGMLDWRVSGVDRCPWGER